MNTLSKDIANHYQSEINSTTTINLMLPRRTENHVDIVLDLETDIRTGLLIEAITPRTFPDSLCLEANNKIISFNSYSLTGNIRTESAIVALQKLLLETKDQSKITAEVIRDGIPITLSAIYDEIILPEVRATIG